MAAKSNRNSGGMTQKQLAALRRILNREAETYQARIGRPVPGQHQSEHKVAITDGRICVLMDVLFPELPIGGRADSFASIVRKERASDSYYPVSADQSRITSWRALARKQVDDVSGVEITVQPENKFELPYVHPIIGRFNPQLLVDAVDAIGRKPQIFLGMGPFSERFPSLLVFPSGWMDNGELGPVAFVLALRI